MEQIPSCCSLESRREEYWGRPRPQYMFRRYGIGGEGTGGTPQMSVAQGN